ncbi:MAG: sigma-70 family RNA polymerase sigma factor [Planctomycetes bacterium]|nr:sigma-70 family RNA polymerase sigma factor [Planctomycetota bacterium]
MNAVEEIRLISGAKHGDAQSFEILVQRYIGRAIRVAYGYVGNRDEATELAQEAFFRVYKSLERFRDGEPFAPWFFRILRNACITYIQKHRRKGHFSKDQVRRDESDSSFELPDQHTTSPHEDAELSETQRQLWSCLEMLSVNHREIIMLRHFEDLDYAAIAEVLDIPIGTVMSRLYHARRKLRDLIEPYMEGRA